MDNNSHNINKINLDSENSASPRNEDESGSIVLPKIELLKDISGSPGSISKRNFLRRYSKSLPFKKWLRRKHLKEQPYTSGAGDKQNKPFIKRRYFKIIAVIFILFSLFLLISGVMVYRVYIQAQKTKKAADNLILAAREQDIQKIKSGLEETKISVAELKSTYRGITWLKLIPFAGAYVSDGEHTINAAVHGLDAADTVVKIIEPYADIIGFTNNNTQASSGAETAQDRLEFVIKTIPDVIPQADALVAKVQKVKEEIDNIDPQRYPEKLGDREIRSKIEKGRELVDVGAELIQNGKPLLEASPYLLGTTGERTYLVLFQNDKELRPTGGFITAYTIASVKNGKFEPGASNDIYNLDDGYTPNIKAPDPLINYLKGPYVLSKKFKLRDLNWSPDFHESMKVFLSEANSAGIKNVDGIIAVDTQLLVNLLDVIGPIGVSGYGEFSTKIVPECSCPQVIYELESFADVEGPIVWSENEPGKIVYAPPNYDNRKKIIGPLMNSILSNTLGQPKEKIAPLFEAIFKSLLEKHVLLYLVEKDKQEAAESFGIAGRIGEAEGDYLHINDANLGGRKSNLYVQQEVTQEVEVKKDGSVEKTVTITYKNPEKHDGWLNSVLPNWVRIYVPKGSELVSFDGLEEKTEPYEDLGKTVFAGFFKLRPEGVAKLTLTYKLPFKVDKDYEIFIQKQPGKDAPLYIINIGKTEEEFFLRTDREIKYRI